VATRNKSSHNLFSALTITLGLWFPRLCHAFLYEGMWKSNDTVVLTRTSSSLLMSCFDRRTGRRRQSGETVSASWSGKRIFWVLFSPFGQSSGTERAVDLSV
jgi:hypothetical protein